MRLILYVAYKLATGHTFGYDPVLDWLSEKDKDKRKIKKKLAILHWKNRCN